MGFLQSIIDKYKAKKRRSVNKDEFLSLLLEAASDGKLDQNEIATLDQKTKDFGLSNEDIRHMRAQAYHAAFKIVKEDGRITAEEASELQAIQKYFNLDDEEIIASKRELARLRLINEVQSGNLPTIDVSNLVLQKGETPHWTEEANLLEERVVRRRYQGGSRGVNIRIVKGLSFRVGAHRGQVVSDTAMLPVSDGQLVLTNKRVIYRGTKKSFNFKLDKILDLEFFKDGIKITEGSGKHRMLKFSNPDNADLVGAVLTQTINNFD